jgi:LytR cell envelope-related transcriptional attenuator
MLDTNATWHGRLPSTPASGVDVTVLNGTGIAGLAARTAASLRELGFRVASVGNTPYTSATTVSYPGPAQAGGAYTLMGALEQAPDNVQDGAAGAVTLTLGTDFNGIVPPQAAGKHHRKSTGTSTTPAAGQQPSGQQPTVPGQSAGIESRNAAENICSGMPDANPDPGTPP